MTKILNQRFSDKNPLRNMHRVIIFEYSVGSSAESIEIGWDFRCLIEFIGGNLRLILIEVKEPLSSILLEDTFAFMISSIVSYFLLVCNCNPILGNSQAQGHSCLQVWLIKAWEYAEAVISLELRVKILLLILLINKWVKTYSVVIVWSQVTKSDSVPSLFKMVLLQLDHMVVKAWLFRNMMIIYI